MFSGLSEEEVQASAEAVKQPAEQDSQRETSSSHVHVSEGQNGNELATDAKVAQVCNTQLPKLQLLQAVPSSSFKQLGIILRWGLRTRSTLSTCLHKSISPEFRWLQFSGAASEKSHKLEEINLQSL